MDLVSGVCSRYFRREFFIGRLVIQPVLLFESKRYRHNVTVVREVRR